MSKFHNTSTELDAWASALGARNDSEAIAVINRLELRIDAATHELQVCLGQMPEGVRRAKLTDETRSWLATSIQNAGESLQFLAKIRRAFARHERGES